MLEAKFEEDQIIKKVLWKPILHWEKVNMIKNILGSGWSVINYSNYKKKAPKVQEKSF